MKEAVTQSLLVAFDTLMILIAMTGAFYLRHLLGDYFIIPPPQHIDSYVFMPLIYGVVLIIMMYEGIYTKRFDFWQENKRIVHALTIACVVIFAVLALQKEAESYSRFILITSFVIMVILIPVEKFLVKRWLHHIGLWQREALVLGEGSVFRGARVWESLFGLCSRR